MFDLAPLPYSYDALEPAIDAQTVQIHHDKHQAKYVENLNAALAREPMFTFDGSLQWLVSNLEAVPEPIRTAVRDNGGGVYNHEFYWNGLCGEKTQPSAEFLAAVNRSFTSMENFKKEMISAAMSVFGSGWAWLCADADGSLKIVKTQNQNTPMNSCCKCGVKLVPILCIDVWEHAYYLKYKNLRAEYLENIWSVINWREISRRYSRWAGLH